MFRGTVRIAKSSKRFKSNSIGLFHICVFAILLILCFVVCSDLVAAQWQSPATIFQNGDCQDTDGPHGFPSENPNISGHTTFTGWDGWYQVWDWFYDFIDMCYYPDYVHEYSCSGCSDGPPCDPSYAQQGHIYCP